MIGRLNLPLSDIAFRELGSVAGEKCGTEEADHIDRDESDDGDAMATKASTTAFHRSTKLEPRQTSVWDRAT